MKIILFFQSTTRKSWFQKLSGIHRFAQEHDWFVQVVERYSTATDIRRALKNWAPAGCLVDRAMSNGRAPDAFFRGIPTVYLDQNPGKPSAEHPCLLHDSAASASLAAQELFANDCQSYAYFGMEKDVHWDKAGVLSKSFIAIRSKTPSSRFQSLVAPSARTTIAPWKSGTLPLKRVSAFLTMCSSLESITTKIIAKQSRRD